MFVFGDNSKRTIYVKYVMSFPFSEWFLYVLLLSFSNLHVIYSVSDHDSITYEVLKESVIISDIGIECTYQLS